MQIGTGELNALQVWGWEETDAVPPGIRRCHWGSVVFRYQLSSPTNLFCLSYEMRFHIVKYQSYEWSWLLIADIAASIHYLRSHYQEAIDIYKRILLDNRLKQLWFLCCFFILINRSTKPHSCPEYHTTRATASSWFKSLNTRFNRVVFHPEWGPGTVSG